MHKKLDNHLLSKVVLLSALTVTSLSAGNAGAAVLVNVTESNGNVIFQGSGSLNTTGLTFQSVNSGPLLRPYNNNGNTASHLYFGIPDTTNYYQLASTLITGTTQEFGDLTSAYLKTPDFMIASSGSGDKFGIKLNSRFANDGYLLLPTNYISGASLSANMTFNNQTFATLGLTSGNSYTWTLGSGSNTDSFTINIGQAVPEPLTILGAGLAAAFGAVFKNKSSRKSEE
jgi:hypothetical protein